MRSLSTALAGLTYSLAVALPAEITRLKNQNISNGIINMAGLVTNQTFDYIICGGGLTGLTVASRLTENPNISVLVIEAGGDHYNDPRVKDVRTYGAAFGSELDHNIYSTPVPWQDDKELLLVAGKMLGGSGSLNGASWTKGAQSQYDLLPMLTGDDSWGWDQFQPFMLMAENFNEPTDQQRDDKGACFDSLAHGYDGPVQVSFGSGMFGGTQLPALEASEKVWKGLTRNSDAASGYPTGATIIPNMVSEETNQTRSSPFTAYAKDQVEQRDKFVILTNHRVTELIWQKDQQDGKLIAEGVHFQAYPNSTLHKVKARREVLLAAGSLQSPQILELSGIGDPSILTAANIPIKHPLHGVGKNMQEQTKNTLTYAAKPDTDFAGSGPPSAITFSTIAQILRNDTKAWYNYTTSNLSIYTSALQTQGKITNATAAEKILRAQIHNLFYSDDVPAAEIFFTITPNATQVGIDNWHLIPLSRGYAHIQSPDPWQHPLVEPSYFEHPLDLAIQTAINEQSRQVFNTTPLSDYITSEIVPGTATVPEGAGGKVWEAWVKETFTSVWHYIATLAMMKEELGGVVDSRLRVYGLRNVRVVDASVLPIQLSAHLSSSLYGIAEKAAVMIQEDQ